MSYDHLNDPLCKKKTQTPYICAAFGEACIHSYWIKPSFGICRNNHFRKCWARSNCSFVEAYSCYKAEFPENLTADHQEEQYILLDQRLQMMGKISSNWEFFQFSHIAKVQFTLYQNNWAVWQFLVFWSQSWSLSGIISSFHRRAQENSCSVSPEQVEIKSQRKRISDI